MKTRLKTSQGSAVLNALIVAGIIAGISVLIMNQTQVTDKSSRGPRVKSAMTVLETQILSLAMQPGTYQNCGQQGKGCQISTKALATFQNLIRPIAGAVCSGVSGGSKSSGNGASCGVKVQAPSSLACLNPKNATYNSGCLPGQYYNTVNQTFCAEIVYQGTEVAMQPLCASSIIPPYVLQGGASSCTSATDLAGPYPKVIFQGYDSNGSAICAPIPNCIGGNVNLPGNYIVAIDPRNMQTQCKSVSANSLGCPSGSIISNVKWKNVTSAFGTLSVIADCKPRKTPPDTHTVTVVPPITVPPKVYVPVGSPPPAPVPTTTTLPSSPPSTLPYCQYCKSGVGWCGNPPMCTTCVVNLPSDCMMPGPTTTLPSGAAGVPTNCTDDTPCTFDGQVHTDTGQPCMCQFLGGNPHPQGYGVCRQNANGSWYLELVRTGTTATVFCK
jgi:hypothetical protein